MIPLGRVIAGGGLCRPPPALSARRMHRSKRAPWEGGGVGADRIWWRALLARPNGRTDAAAGPESDDDAGLALPFEIEQGRTKPLRRVVAWRCGVPLDRVDWSIVDQPSHASIAGSNGRRRWGWLVHTHCRSGDPTCLTPCVRPSTPNSHTGERACWKQQQQQPSLVDIMVRRVDRLRPCGFGVWGCVGGSAVCVCCFVLAAKVGVGVYICGPAARLVCGAGYVLQLLLRVLPNQWSDGPNRWDGRSIDRVDGVHQNHMHTDEPPRPQCTNPRRHHIPLQRTNPTRLTRSPWTPSPPSLNQLDQQP